LNQLARRNTKRLLTIVVWLGGFGYGRPSTTVETSWTIWKHPAANHLEGAMFGRFRRRRALEREARAYERERARARARGAGRGARPRWAEVREPDGWESRDSWDTWEDAREHECPVCWGYGSVECRRCNETGDLDPTNDRDLDCPYCQGWGAITCTHCGGSGRR